MLQNPGSPNLIKIVNEDSHNYDGSYLYELGTDNDASLIDLDNDKVNIQELINKVNYSNPDTLIDQLNNNINLQSPTMDVINFDLKSDLNESFEDRISVLEDLTV